MRIARALTALTITVPMLWGIGASGAAAAKRSAAAPVGTWRWSDNDEALANPRNPHDLHVRARGRAGGLIARFGSGTWVPFTWRASRRTFAFSVPRRVGPRGERRLSVSYSGHVALVGGRWTASGRLKIASPRFPGRSSFSATRLR